MGLMNGASQWLLNGGVTPGEKSFILREVWWWYGGFLRAGGEKELKVTHNFARKYGWNALG